MCRGSSGGPALFVRVRRCRQGSRLHTETAADGLLQPAFFPSQHQPYIILWAVTLVPLCMGPILYPSTQSSGNVKSELYKHRKSGDHVHVHPQRTMPYAHVNTMLVRSSRTRPASFQRRYGDLGSQFDRVLGRRQKIIDQDIPSFRWALRDERISAVSTASNRRQPVPASATD